MIKRINSNNNTSPLAEAYYYDRHLTFYLKSMPKKLKYSFFYYRVEEMGSMRLSIPSQSLKMGGKYSSSSLFIPSTEN